MATEETLVKALENAQKLGVQLVRGGVLFDWTEINGELPRRCNAIGALLLLFGQAKRELGPDWIENLCRAAEIKPAWMWRFIHGWDYGNKLTITFIDKKTKKEEVEVDSVSRYADKLARTWVK